MSELKVSAVVDLEGNLSRRARQYSRDLSRFSASGNRSMGRLRQGVAATGRGLERLGSRYTALIAGAAGVGAIKQVAALDARMTQLGVNTDMSAEKVNTLKKRIFETATLPDIRVDPSQLLDAIEKIVAKTGRVDVAIGNLENIGRTIRATGAAGQDAGDLVANIFDKFNVTQADEVLRVLDTMALQGKEGAFEMKDLATQGNDVMAAFAAAGQDGMKGLREMGALLQIIRNTSSSPDEAATAFKRLLSTLTIEKVGDLQELGVKIWDEEKLKEGVKIARSIPDIIKDVIRKTKGDTEELGKIFEIRALEGLAGFANEFKKTGNFDSLDKFLAMQGDGNQLMADSARNAGTATAAMTSLYTILKKFADEELSEPIQSIADALNDMDPDRIMQVMKAIAIGAGSLIGFAAGAKVFRGVRGLTGGKKGLAGTLGASAGVTPVFVTNFPGVPGVGGAGARVGGAAATGAGVAKFGLLRSAGAVGLSAAAGVGVGTVIKNAIDETTFYEKIGEAINDILAGFGLESAKRNRDIMREAQGYVEPDPENITRNVGRYRRGQEQQKVKTDVSGTIKLEIMSDKPVKTRELSSNNKDIDFSVGPAMAGAY